MNSTAAVAIDRTIRSVKIAFPTITTGWRARREWRLGSGTLSGSRAARGLRGKGGFADEEPPSAGRSEFTWRAPESILTPPYRNIRRRGGERHQRRAR